MNSNPITDLLRQMRVEQPNVEDTQTVAGGPAPFRNVREMPHSQTAQASFGALVRATQDVGYASVAKAVGHDKSWLSRVLSGDLKASIFEWLHWFDVCNLRLRVADEEREEDAELLQILLRKAALTIERRQTERRIGEAIGERVVQVDADEYRALLALAKRGVLGMQTGRDRCGGCERA